mgnify:CR=1 FL=1
MSKFTNIAKTERVRSIGDYDGPYNRMVRKLDNRGIDRSRMSPEQEVKAYAIMMASEAKGAVIHIR